MHVKVDYRTISIIPMADALQKKFDGLFSNKEGTIEINPTLDPPSQADTLIHEIIHALYATRGWRTQMTEEQVCGVMGGGLATVFRDNPDLPLWLEHALIENVPIVTKGV